MQLSPRLGIAILLGVGVLVRLESPGGAHRLRPRRERGRGASACARRAPRSSSSRSCALQGIALAIPRALRGMVAARGAADRDAELLPLLRGRAHPAGARAARLPDFADALRAAHLGAAARSAPRWSALAPMALALAGLALALDLRAGASSGALERDRRPACAWAFASGSSMAVVYYLNAQRAQGVDGRLRTFAMTAVTAVLVDRRAATRGARHRVRRADATGLGRARAASPVLLRWR